MGVILTILPIMLTMVFGWILVTVNIIPRDRWSDVETLSFRVLIPVVLISSIAQSDLSISEFGPTILALIATLVIAGSAVMMLRLIRGAEKLPNPTLTTLFGTTTRWNAFIALAAAEQFLGAEGVAIVAVAMAVLVPLIQIANVGVLAGFGPSKANPGLILRAIAYNPIVQGCAVGLVLNLSGIGLGGPIERMFDMIGGAAIGVGLLAVGAGIELSRLTRNSSLLWLGLLLRQALCPMLFLLFASLLVLSANQTLIGAVVLSVPAATNGYIIAKQMGGNADLYADIMAWQTILSMILLPTLAYFLVG